MHIIWFCVVKFNNRWGYSNPRNIPLHGEWECFLQHMTFLFLTLKFLVKNVSILGHTVWRCCSEISKPSLVSGIFEFWFFIIYACNKSDGLKMSFHRLKFIYKKNQITIDNNIAITTYLRKWRSFCWAVMLPCDPPFFVNKLESRRDCKHGSRLLRYIKAYEKCNRCRYKEKVRINFL